MGDASPYISDKLSPVSKTSKTSEGETFLTLDDFMETDDGERPDILCDVVQLLTGVVIKAPVNKDLSQQLRVKLPHLYNYEELEKEKVLIPSVIRKMIINTFHTLCGLTAAD